MLFNSSLKLNTQSFLAPVQSGVGPGWSGAVRCCPVRLIVTSEKRRHFDIAYTPVACSVAQPGYGTGSLLATVKIASA